MQSVIKKSQSVVAGQTSLTDEKIYLRPTEIKPSPKNDKVYKPVSRGDASIKELAKDIAKNGLLEPIVISKDRYILSGHRRRQAAIVARQMTVPCYIKDVYHDDPEFMRLLVSFNNQRVKTNPELLREAIVKADPDEAHQSLVDHRDEQTIVKAETIEVGNKKPRKKISDVKSEMVEAAIDVVDELRNHWPLSDRQIHYKLLNNPPFRNTKKTESTYANNEKCYNDLCDLLTRLRLVNKIPMNAIADPTRPTTSWRVNGNPQEFAVRELNDFLKGYWRNLQQSQPLHIEVIAEKMTVQSIVKSVCAKFTVPYSIGRGYSSLPARWEIVKRFRASGKDKLLLIVLSDFDPEGVNIGESLLQSIREDFGIDNAEAVRAGINPQDIERFKLHDNPAEAKKTSSRYKDFVKRFGKSVYELEALSPEQLQQLLTEAIDSVIDIDAFNVELEAERGDAVYLQAFRERVYNNSIELLDFESEA